jgi:hypothetical protein
MAAEHVLHMQKRLDQSNRQIHRVLNDITELSGLGILGAILAGERDLGNPGQCERDFRHDSERRSGLVSNRIPGCRRTPVRDEAEQFQANPGKAFGFCAAGGALDHCGATESEVLRSGNGQSERSVSF